MLFYVRVKSLLLIYGDGRNTSKTPSGYKQRNEHNETVLKPTELIGPRRAAIVLYMLLRVYVTRGLRARTSVDVVRFIASALR